MELTGITQTPPPLPPIGKTPGIHEGRRDFLVLMAAVCWALGLVSLWPTNLINGKWVDGSGEIWEIHHDGSILTNNPKYPQRSYRWNLRPIAIHLFYGPNQQSPQGGFEVVVLPHTLVLTPAWKGRHQPWVLNRIFEPSLLVLPGIILATTGFAIFYHFRLKRIPRPCAL